MNAIVLAGGFGTRLRPFTDNCPKPMLTLANRPVLDHVVAQLKYYGLDDIVFTLGYLPGMIEDLVRGYRGVRAAFSVETEPLGTAGGVKKAEQFLDDVFVVVSGDAVSDVDLGEMIRFHLSSSAAVTMAVVSVSDPSRYGVVELAEDGVTVGGFVEKPQRAGLGKDGVTVGGFVEKPQRAERGVLVNAGIYVVDKRVLSYVPDGCPFDFSRDLFPQLVAEGSLKAFRHDGYWCDVGDKAEFFRANFALKNGGLYPAVPSFFEERMACRVKGDSLISCGAVTVGGYYDSVIGYGARIASGAHVYRCVVLPGALVTGKHRYCVIGENFVEYLPEVEAEMRINGALAENFLQTGP